MKANKLMKFFVALGVVAGAAITAGAPTALANSTRGDVREVSVNRVGLNSAGQTVFTFRVVLEKNTNAFVAMQIGPRAQDVVARQRVRCSHQVARWRDTCFVDVSAVLPQGVKRAGFVAIPSTPGDAAVAIAVQDPYQWDVAKRVINVGAWSVAGQILLCESKFGAMESWAASPTDRQQFQRMYKVEAWSRVFALFLNDSGLVLSLVPTDRLARGDVLEIIVENVASAVWNEVLKMPTVTIDSAIKFGQIMAGYSMKNYLARLGC